MSVPSSTPARNVIFDFGGVLLRWRPQEVIDAFYAEEDLRGSLSRNVFRHPDWVEMDRGSLSEDTAVQRFAARMNRPVQEMQTLLQLVKESLVPLPQTVGLLHELAGRGVPLYGLSNMPASMFGYLRGRYDHWRLFRGIVISGEVQLTKPDPAIFAYICRQHQLEPAETIFVDDLAPNIEAADKLGFRTILFRDAERCAQDLDRFLGNLNSHAPRGPSPERQM
jgi:putative hydrolase of the HAD superfamily